MPLSAIVFGAYGLVGSYLLDELQKNKVAVCGVDKIEHAGLLNLDIRENERVYTLLRELSPKLVFIPAAITNVEQCEQYPELTYETNVIAICKLIQASCSINAKVVFFSTDYIFDGTSGPYSEAVPANPICAYGRQKLITEHFLLSQTDNYLIIRTTSVYGWEKAGKNFAMRLINQLNSGRTIKVPIDQITTPTYAPELAMINCLLALEGHRGVFNVVGNSYLSRYEFACDIARIFNLDGSLILPVHTVELGQLAPRPLNGGLITDKVTLCIQNIVICDHRLGLQTMLTMPQYPADNLT